MSDWKYCKSAAAVAEGVAAEIYPDDLNVLESNELGPVGPEGGLVVATRFSSSRDGVRFEQLSGARNMSPRAARRTALELLRGAAFAELRGCHPDYPCWPRRSAP